MLHTKASQIRFLFYIGISTGILLNPIRGHSAGIVTSSSESALDSALSGGGEVILAFDGTIFLTGTKTISTNTVIDASGHAVTISGGNNVQIFNVASGTSLTLLNLTLADGRSNTNGGGIFNSGNVLARGVVFTNNNVVATNGLSGQNGANGGGGNGNGGIGAAGITGGNARGGAIHNLGTLTLYRCSFQSNSVVGGDGGGGGNGGNASQGASSGGNGGAGGSGGLAFGGAVFSTNSVAMTNCLFFGNSATGGNAGSAGTGGTGPFSGLDGQGGAGGEGSGAAVYSFLNSLTIGCVFYDGNGKGGNSTTGGTASNGNGISGSSGGNSFGGGFCNLGTNVAVINTTLFNNKVTGGNGGNGGDRGQFGQSGGNGGNGGIGSGGGIYSLANIGITNCTFSTNAVYGGSGGAAGSGGFPGGTAGSAGATQGANIARGGGTFTLKNSILAYKATDGNSYGTITDAGRNISSDATPTLTGALGSTNNLDPKLAALANNGGFAKTCALLSTSPAIDMADSSAAPLQDQRGYYRSGVADIGAYEYNGIRREVSVVANGPIASEDGETGLFTIERSSVSTNALTVFYAISGTASNGVDYVTISNSVTIPGNESQTRVFVRPIADALIETAETVVLTLTASSEYEIGSPSSATVTLLEFSNFDRSPRYVRGTGSDPTLHSFVIPLDLQRGIPLDAVGGNATNLFPGNSWATLYHYDATNAGSQNFASNRIAFQNPIVAFGERVGGTPLYFGEHTRFGIYAGVPYYIYSVALWIGTYEKTNGTVVYRNGIYIPLPSPTSLTDWNSYLTNGYTKTVTANGLTTTVTFNQNSTLFGETTYGANSGGTMMLTHSADASASNYIFEVEMAGVSALGGMVVDGSGSLDYSRLYTLEFEQRPPWRSVFLDQPHFTGEPVPPAYQGKTVDELLTNPPPVATTFSLSNSPSTYTNLDQSPELRRHPMLDQFVSDMRNDPVALARYVHNEIELTDALDFNDNGSVSEVSVNPPGVARGALGTFLEGQGGPAEQCALLVYLLRQAGTPAVYVYPSHNGMKLLDSQLSRLLRMQFSGAVNNLGQVYTTNNLIPVNYPWVAAYIGTNWVHLFPWLKDTQIEEGLNLRDYMSAEYPNAYKWMSGYLYGRTNILSLSTGDDTAGVLFPRWLQNNLALVAPGVSLDDIGVKCVNRRHSYARWSDFPLPFVTPTNGIALDSLSSTAVTNVFPGLTNIFDTFKVDVSSRATPSKKISSGDLRLVDLHNRRLLISHMKTGANTHDMILSLAAFRSNASGPTNFAAGDTLLNLQSIKTNLTSTDDVIDVVLTYKRHRALPPSTFTNPPIANQTYAGIYGVTTITDNRAIRKGDLAAICLNVGRVTRPMLNVQAEELWNMERTLAANPSATNSFSSDLYQGGPAFLMGMAYFENTSRFRDIGEQLNKVRVVSQYGHGLAKLVAKRVSGALPNSGDIILNQPGVDMSFSSTALAYSATIHPASGEDKADALADFGYINAAHYSAEEHQILNAFFRESDSISTVKLLQLAQGRPGPGVQWLSYSNYIQVGNSNFSGTLLKNSDASMWASVTNFFNVFDAKTRQVFITPGTVTNQSNTYKGVGAFMVTPGYYYAGIISGNQNGGVAPVLTDVALTSPNLVNYRLQISQFGDFVLTYTPSGASSLVLAPDAFAHYDSVTISANASANFYKYSDYQNKWTGNASDLLNLPPQGALNLNFSQSVQAAQGDQGFLSWLGDALSQAGSHVADPVHAVTGEFYIQANDLTLPGPMPLTISRNYSSLNLADNQFGFGWKLNYMPFLSVSADTNVIYAAEADGAVLAYEKTATNANVYLPTTAKNPQLSNNREEGIGSVANRLRNRIEKQVSGPDTYYYLYPPSGGKRTFKLTTYTGSVNRTRPYLTKWEDSRGNFFTFEYGADSTKPDFAEVRRIQSSNGAFLGLVYDVYGHIIEAYTGDGRRLKYDYDQFGDLVKVTKPDASEIGYEYEHKSQSITNGSTVTVAQYSTHLVLKENKPDGRVLKNEYDQHRRVTNQWATAGADLTLVRNATFIYANNFNLTNSFTNTITGYTIIKDVFNNTNRYDYTNGLITKITDALNQAVTQDWFEVSETNKAGYYPRSLESRTDVRGLVTLFKYDANGNVTNTVVTGDLTGDGTAQNATNTIAYDANNLPTLTTDPVGNKVQTLYHSQFPFLPEYVVRLAGSTPVSSNKMFYTSATNTILFGTTTYTNLAVGLLQREIRAFGSSDAATNDFAYDGRGYVTQSVRYTGTSDPAVTNTYYFSDRGELLEQTDAAGRKTKRDYDPLGRPRYREVYEAGQTVPLAWEYSYYNDNGELTWSDGPRYNPEDYVWRDYDGAGRNITEIHWRSQAKTDGSGMETPSGYDLFAQTFREYDAFNNLKRTIDPRGAITTNTWDALGQLVQTKSFDLNGTTVLTSEGFAYEPGGQVRFHTNALGGVTETQYTINGLPKYRKNADGSTNAWRYYVDGRSYREIQGNGAYWQTTYEDANRKITRIFYSPASVPLATNISEFDRRNNLVKRTDAGGFVFTNSFDGLDRVKISAGPPVVTVTENCTVPFCGNYVTNILQQKTTAFYDAAGITVTNVNALGEKSITTSDALGRPVIEEIRDTNNVLVRVTSTDYSADHHSVTVTNGFGSSAIVATTYTDNDGRTVLSVAYPHANMREFTRRDLDLAGNLEYEERDSVTNGIKTAWSSAGYSYDGLNRTTVKSDRDAAQTILAYNGLGNVTNRTMPGGLQWQARFNSAGQILEEKNVGSGSVATRTNAYAYYAIGSPFAGLLQTSTDGRGVTCSHTYDNWLRPDTDTYDGALPEHDFAVTRAYDLRGFLTGIAETSTGYSLGNVGVGWTFDAYGQMTSETVGNYGLYNTATQGWDAAGRRRQLSFGGFAAFAYSFSWRADGLLNSAATPVGSGSYAYNSAGVLTNRNVGPRSTTTTSLDGVGRPLSLTTKVSLITSLTETLAWTGDGLLSAHTLNRASDFTDSRAYTYANLTRRLTEERLNLDSTKRWTNSFAYDGGATAGPGSLTKIGPASGSARWTGGADAFARISLETNVSISRPASGKVNGPATLTASLDGVPQPVSVYSVNDATWTNRWNSTLEIAPGAHQLVVSAKHPSGQFTTNASVWFTNNLASERVTDTFDGAGYVTQRLWKSPSGTTNRTQNLSWDARGRLVKVNERDASANGYDWAAIYDPLGRRIQTRTFTVTNGSVIIESSKTTMPFFDPVAEFLELGAWVDYQQTIWKLYGPDLNGQYGGLNGTGGFEAVAPGLNVFNPTVSDARGNILGVVTNGIAVNWTAARPTGYGAVPSHKPLPLGFGGDMVTSASWRGRPVDITGFVNLGARNYIPDSGSFLGSDPVWNDRDPNYYSFAGGDPINYFDADGRFTKKAAAVGFDVLATIFATIATPQPPPFSYVSPLDQQIYENRAKMIQDAIGHPFQDAGVYEADSGAAAIRDVTAMGLEMYGIAKSGKQMVNVNVAVPEPVWTQIPNVTSPNAAARQAVQGSYINPLSNEPIPTTEPLAADHIYPQVEIKQLPGFNQLTPAQQAVVLNNLQNFQGLPKTFNSSKGGQLPADWLTYKGQPLDPNYVERNRQLQIQIQQMLQTQIKAFNQQNVKK